MGSGKSSVAVALSQELSLSHYDSDAEIKRLSHQTIEEYFRRSGDDAFRALETRALDNLLKQPRGIIATGGGVVSTEPGRELLAACGATIIWLKVNFTTAAERIGRHGEFRPLFRDMEAAYSLFQARQPFYEAAAEVVVDADQALDNVVANIVQGVPHD